MDSAAATEPATGERGPLTATGGLTAEQPGRYEIVGEGAHAMEALRLEISRLARRYGVKVRELRVETVTEGDHTST